MNVDVTQFPLVVVRFSPEPSDEELEAAIKATADLYRRRQKVAFVVILDVRLKTFGASRRERLNNLMASIQADADELMLGVAYVSGASLVRGIVTALNWARGTRPYPVKVVTTTTEGMALADGWLATQKKKAAAS